jgi:hypothetical protein
MGRLDESKNGDVTADGKAASARMLGYLSSVVRSLNRGSGASSGGGSGAAMLYQSARAAPRFCVSCSAATLVSWSPVSVVSDCLVMLRDLRTQCCRGGASVSRGANRWSRAQGNRVGSWMPRLPASCGFANALCRWQIVGCFVLDNGWKALRFRSSADELSLERGNCCVDGGAAQGKHLFQGSLVVCAPLS